MSYLWGFEVDLEWDADSASSLASELGKPPAEAKFNAFPRRGCMVSPPQGSFFS